MKKKKRKRILVIIILLVMGAALLIVDQKWGVARLWNSYFTGGKKVVVLDAGHGGTDPGCGLGSPYEKEITFNIVKEAQKELEKQGYVVVLTREDDSLISLGDRVLCSRVYNGDLFVSVHLNWAENTEAYGIETYCNQELNGNSAVLAKALQKNVLDVTESNDRKIHVDSDFYVVRNSKVPSCLVEVGFLSSKKEGKKLKNEEYQKRISEGIVEGINQYLTESSEK
ncbi:MAG: N-acetylmuramoyl-L-alanine amidase [Eubacterium sp.]|nr:N-acetylmuramoyl-L-alanine amidase [Eubacterium sp.]